jgi:hypothetical protein
MMERVVKLKPISEIKMMTGVPSSIIRYHGRQGQYAYKVYKTKENMADPIEAEQYFLEHRFEPLKKVSKQDVRFAEALYKDNCTINEIRNQLNQKNRKKGKGKKNYTHDQVRYLLRMNLKNGLN